MCVHRVLLRGTCEKCRKPPAAEYYRAYVQLPTICWQSCRAAVAGGIIANAVTTTDGVSAVIYEAITMKSVRRSRTVETFDKR